MSERDEIREWLRGKLAAAGHGSKIKLARHVGVSSDAVTRMLNAGDGKETRQISAVELGKMREFFEALEAGINPTALPDSPASIEKRYRDLPPKFQKAFEVQLAALEQLASATPSAGPPAKDDQE